MRISLPSATACGLSLGALAACEPAPPLQPDCSDSAAPTVTVVPASAEVAYEASLVVTALPRYRAGHAVTGMSILGVPLTPVAAGWSATLPWEVLQPAAWVAAGSASTGVVTLPLSTEVCDLCGCTELPAPPTVVIDPFNATLSGEITIVLTTSVSPPWLPADGATLGQLTLSTTDLAAVELPVTVAIQGGELVSGTTTSTTLSLPFVGNGTTATAQAWIRSATPGTALVTATASEAWGYETVPFVAAPVSSADTLTLTGDGTVSGIVQSPGGLLRSCTWTSADSAVTAFFVPGGAGPGQAWVLTLDPPADDVAFTVTSLGLAEAATAQIACVDLYGQASSTVEITAAPPSDTGEETDTGADTGGDSG